MEFTSPAFLITGRVLFFELGFEIGEKFSSTIGDSYPPPSLIFERPLKEIVESQVFVEAILSNLYLISYSEKNRKKI